jgi:hypothetical protein
MVDVMLLEDLVAELGAGFKGEELGLGESIVAVEEDVVNLWVMVSFRFGPQLGLSKSWQRNSKGSKKVIAFLTLPIFPSWSEVKKI